MKPETQIELVKRILSHIENKTTDSGHQSFDIQAAQYMDPEHHNREISELFNQTPRLIAGSAEISQPGDYICRDEYGLPLIIMRTKTGELKAYLNSCRHRGARLLNEPSGKARNITCNYHGWNYNTDGRLQHVPHGEGFPQHKDPRFCLKELPLLESDGLVWLTPQKDLNYDLADFLKELGADLSQMKLQNLQVFQQKEEVIDANWKLLVEGFMEAYHIRFTHRNTFYKRVYDNLALHDIYGKHSRTVYPLRSISKMAEKPDSTWNILKHSSVLYHFFPNSFITAQNNFAALIHLIPKGAGQTVFRYTILADENKIKNFSKRLNGEVAVLMAAIVEDFAMARDIQKNMVADPNNQLHFGHYEQLLVHFHQNIQTLVPPKVQEISGSVLTKASYN